MGTSSNDLRERVGRLAPLVFAWIYLELGRCSEREDLAQEVFVRAFSTVGRLRDEHSVKAWLRTITMRVCADYRRRGGERLSPTGPLADVAEGRSAAIEIEDEESRARVRCALARLEIDEREVLLLKFYAEEPTSEIARLLGVSIRAVQKRLARACERMRHLLQEESERR
ncbi:MAG: sigma-70 family RNA polymerase sigma factor [Planctomycetota bacterium]